MNPIIKRSIVGVIRARQRRLWKAPANRATLSSSERRQVEEVWGEIWSQPSYEWHEHFKFVNGSFDPLYVPVDTFFLDLMPRLSNLSLSTAWEDKAYYGVRFPDIPFPKLIAACIDGSLVDGDLVPCEAEDLWREVTRFNGVFIKPSIGSYQGIGAFKLNSQDLKGPDDLKKALAGSGDNYVVQELIKQHELLSEFNPCSVNIIRMVSVCLGRDPFLANATLRFGISGSATDVTYVDGVETARVVGLTKEGRVKDFYYDQDGRRQPVSEIGIDLAGVGIPGFKRACEICSSVHKRAHHFGIIGFDVAIDHDAEPIMVEMNLGGPGAVFYQYANGPFFGERTLDVIKWCETRKVRQKPWELSI